MLIDAHCHLDDEQFANDLDAVIARAADTGVKSIVTAGADVSSSRAAVALAEKYAGVYAVAGVHPEHAATFDDKALEAIRDLAQHRKVIGIGEIGLDFYWENNPPREMQASAFVTQMNLAQELGKPVVIHDRDAHTELIEILQRRKGKPRGVLHCFSGDLEMARRAIDLGYYISFAGNVTFKNARHLQEIARAVPLERIIIETDSPYLSPQRGKRNEPANVVMICSKIAELKDSAISLVAETTTHNIQLLFGLAQTE
jgi:TatD DNase family protein